MFLFERRFFTLLEILLVIGTVSILFALLLTSVSLVRSNAAGIRCLSNMKQLSLVYAMYSSDNDEYLPCLENFGGAGALNIKGEPLTAKNWLNDLLLSYLPGGVSGQSANEVLLCPRENSRDDIVTNYGLNYLAANRGEGIQISTFPNPSKTSMLVENYGHLCYYCGVKNEEKAHVTGSLYGNNRAAAFRHNRKAAVAFLDFHAALLLQNQIPCQESYPDLSVETLRNTYFNEGDIDSGKSSVSGL